MPMRTSLPSMLQLAGLTPSAVIRGLGWASKYQVIRFVTISMHEHDQPDVPAVQPVVDHPAVVIGQAGDHGKEQHQLQELGQRRGVLEGMGAVGAGDARAVQAQHLRCRIGGHRALARCLHGRLAGAAAAD